MSAAGRECGSCTLCCTAMIVHELNKRAYVPCQHLCSSGCTIYAERPRSCQRFECLWLKGEVPEWARPDKINVVFTESSVRVAGQKPPIVVIEAVKDASEVIEVREIMQDFVMQEIYEKRPPRDVYIMQPGGEDREQVQG